MNEKGNVKKNFGGSIVAKVNLSKSARPWTAESLANLEALKARLLAENPGAKVTFDFKDVYGPSV